MVPTATPFIALTATATQNTKEIIFDVLRMSDNCVEICDSPNKLNICYSAQYMDKNVELEQYLHWIIASVQEKGINAERVIIYCQTIKQSHLIYTTLKSKLGISMYMDGINSPGKAMVEMLHSCTPAENKNAILESFQNEQFVF